MTLPSVAHPVAPLLHDAAEHGVSIALLQGINKEEKEGLLCYGTHAAALNEEDFIHAE